MTVKYKSDSEKSIRKNISIRRDDLLMLKEIAENTGYSHSCIIHFAISNHYNLFKSAKK